MCVFNFSFPFTFAHICLPFFSFFDIRLWDWIIAVLFEYCLIQSHLNCVDFSLHVNFGIKTAKSLPNTYPDISRHSSILVAWAVRVSRLEIQLNVLLLWEITIDFLPHLILPRYNKRNECASLLFYGAKYQMFYDMYWSNSRRIN